MKEYTLCFSHLYKYHQLLKFRLLLSHGTLETSLRAEGFDAHFPDKDIGVERFVVRYAGDENEAVNALERAGVRTRYVLIEEDGAVDIYVSLPEEAYFYGD